MDDKINNSLNYPSNNSIPLPLDYLLIPNFDFIKSLSTPSSSFELIQNKLWKSFIKNDGLMTEMLQNLFEDKLRFKYISSEIIELNKQVDYDINFKNNYLLNLISSNLQTDKVLKRLIHSCDNNDDIILEGISYWNEEVYNNIIKGEKDSIGVLIKKKKIEIFKQVVGIFIIRLDELDNFKVINESIHTTGFRSRSVLLMRVITYQMNGKVNMVLLETINTCKLVPFLNKFE